MNQTLAIWLLVLLAFGLANLPFLSKRMLGVVPVKTSKNLAIRLLELAICYAIAGAFGLFLEQRSGQIAPQGWEFYAVTGTLFLTFAFPGFTYRYLYKRRS